MFKLSKNINDSELIQIKESTRQSFGHETYSKDDINEYGIIYDNNNVACSGLINQYTKFIFNLCTHPSYRKKGYATYLMKIMIYKYKYKNKYQLLILETENDLRGKVPRQIYSKLGWKDVETNHSRFRNLMFFIPLTGICDYPTRLITNDISTKINILKSFQQNPISTLNSVIRFILQKDSSIHLSNLQDYPKNESMDFYQHLYLYNKKKFYYLYNHLLLIEPDSNYYIESLKLLQDNFKISAYFCLILIYDNHFCIINKIHEKKEFIVSSKLPIFISINNLF